MIRILNYKIVKANKEHHCYFCGKTIEKGEQYHKSVAIYDNILYETKICKYCHFVSPALDMYDYFEGEGLSDEDFRAFIEQYVYDNHFDNNIDDVAKDWQLPLAEQVKKIYNELKTNEKYKYLWDVNVANK